MATAKGLLNMPGQNNCFLNSAVQVLWHLDIFRRSFRELSGHACMGSESCIFCALKELFTQFQYSEESALPPDSLRKALAETFSNQRRFQLGFMDDAAECFENILLRIHDHIAHDEPEDSCSAPHCISHEKFAMNLVEQVNCSSCGYTSEPHPFTQLVNYVSSPALCVQAKKLMSSNGSTINNSNISFASLLRYGEAYGNIRDCPNNCGAKIVIRKTLVNQPDIVSIGLVWDSERPSLNQITQVFSIIGTQLNLKDVFDGFGPVNTGRPVVSTANGSIGCLPSQVSSSSSSTLELVGLVTYYGKHYSTFFYHTNLSCWIYFDDAAVREIGPHWDQVVDKCIKGHFQPLLLLYANPSGTTINASTAPQSIIRVANHPTSTNKSTSKCNGNSVNRVANGFHSYLRPTSSHLRSTMAYPLPGQQFIPPNCSSSSVSSLASLPVKPPHRPLSLLSLPSQPIKQQQSTGSLPRSKGIYGTMRLPTKRSAITNRPGSMDDLLNQYGSASDDVPDSPLTRSSVSSTYFSDIGETDSGYISRKTVESILSMQKQQSPSANHHHQQTEFIFSNNKGQRSSLSSVDSYSTELGLTKKSLDDKLMLSVKACSLQRRDSGNSSNGSGDRMSASSISSITSRDDNLSLIGHYARSFSKPLINGYRYGQSQQQLTSSSSSTSSTSSSGGGGGQDRFRSSHIDQGYDSFSLSSSDSYPSIGQITPTKQQPGYFNSSSRLTQIPEDTQLMGLMADGQQPSLQDCDQLCNQSDVLMMKSIEKEREGDLISAAALSDSAAHKARFAMAAPYSNPQMLVSAKMKHSICVMRSANLHKRIKEMEAEEKRRAKLEAAAAAEINGHSRQGSRDSGHGRQHSRQNSRDGSVKEMKKEIKENKKPSTNNSNTNNSNINNNDDCFTGNKKTIQLYATLPKKSCQKKLLSTIVTNNSETSNHSKGGLSCYIEKHQQPANSINNNKKSDKICDSSKNDAESSINGSIGSIKGQRQRLKNHKTLSVYSFKDSDLSDNYYSEWETVKGGVESGGIKEPLKRSLSGSTTTPLTTGSTTIVNQGSVKSNDADIYSETSCGDLVSSESQSSKKQHKIRRKLLIGSFMKRKNRSLPDLRENAAKSECLSSSEDHKPSESSLKRTSIGDDSCINTPKTVAKISKKGFHQGMGVYQRSSLLKVNPPLLEPTKLEAPVVPKIHLTVKPVKPIFTHQQSQPQPQSQSQSQHQQEPQPVQHYLSYRHLIPRPPTPPRPKSSDELSTINLINESRVSLAPKLIQPAPSPNPPTPPPPPPLATDEVDCCLIKPGSPSQGIEPNEELPPPPESFLQELREKRNEMSSESLLGRLTSEKLASSSYESTFNELPSSRAFDSLGSCTLNHDVVDSMKSNVNKSMQQKSTEPNLNVIKGSSAKTLEDRRAPSVKDLASRFQQMSLPHSPTPSLSSSVPASSSSTAPSSLKPQSMQASNNTLHQRTPSLSSCKSSFNRSSSSSSLSSLKPALSIPATASSSINSSIATTTTASSITLPNTSLTVNSSSTSSLRQGLRVVTLLGSTMRNNNMEPGQQSTSTTSTTNNNQVSLSSSNLAPTNLNGPGRPERPPDYQTAIKRLSLMKDLKRLSQSSSPSTVLPNGPSGTGSPVIDHHPMSSTSSSSSVCPPLVRPTPITASNGQTLTSNQSSSSINIPNSKLTVHENLTVSSPTMESINSTEEITISRRKESTPKKSVSFSDQVVLVAPAEDDDEEYLPNPLLQRVLSGKKVIT